MTDAAAVLSGCQGRGTRVPLACKRKANPNRVWLLFTPGGGSHADAWNDLNRKLIFFQKKIEGNIPEGGRLRLNAKGDKLQIELYLQNIPFKFNFDFYCVPWLRYSD